MKITISHAALATELRILQAAVSRKPPIPALGYFRVSADDIGAARVSLAATDLAIAIETTAEAAIEATGVALLPAATLAGLVAACPSGSMVQIEGGADEARVVCHDFAATIRTLPDADFPSLAAPPDVAVGTVEAAALARLVRRTSFAVSGDDTRYYLNGARFEFGGGAARMVATDGHRLAVADEPAEGDTTGPQIVPRRALAALPAWLEAGGDGPTAVRYAVGERHLFFDLGTRRLASRVIDGTFPSYGRILGVELPRTATVSRAPLAEAVRRVALFSPAVVRLDCADGAMRVTGRGEGGSGEDVVPARAQADMPRLSVNPRYLLDGLGAMTDADEIALQCKDSATQICVSPVAPDARRYAYLVMPISEV